MVDSTTKPTAAAATAKTEEKPVVEQKVLTEEKPTATAPTTKPDEPKTEELSTDGPQNENTPETTKDANSPIGRTPPRSLEIDKTKPVDFEGEIATTNEIPSPETLKKLDNYLVLDRHGKTHTFKSLYAGGNVARRVLIIFVRHFFCGVGQLSADLSTDLGLTAT